MFNNVTHLKALITSIEAKENYKSHTVIDANKCRIIVITKDNKWFDYSDKHSKGIYTKHEWNQITEEWAQWRLESHYFPQRFNEMKGL